jgi:hypothetical protein
VTGGVIDSVFNGFAIPYLPMFSMAVNTLCLRDVCVFCEHLLPSGIAAPFCQLFPPGICAPGLWAGDLN